MRAITTVLTEIGGATTVLRYLRIYHLIQLIKSCRSPIIFSEKVRLHYFCDISEDAFGEHPEWNKFSGKLGKLLEDDRHGRLQYGR